KGSLSTVFCLPSFLSCRCPSKPGPLLRANLAPVVRPRGPPVLPPVLDHAATELGCGAVNMSRSAGCDLAKHPKARRAAATVATGVSASDPTQFGVGAAVCGTGRAPVLPHGRERETGEGRPGGFPTVRGRRGRGPADDPVDREALL